MAVVQLSQFDITVGQLYHFATGGFWANLPRFCRNVPAARLLLVSDTLNPQHIQDGFTAAAQSEDGLPPSLRAFRMQYEDYLGQMSREVERAVNGRTRVVPAPHPGGTVHEPGEILNKILEAAR